MEHQVEPIIRRHTGELQLRMMLGHLIRKHPIIFSKELTIGKPIDHGKSIVEHYGKKENMEQLFFDLAFAGYGLRCGYDDMWGENESK